MITIYCKVLVMGLHDNDKHGITLKGVGKKEREIFIEMEPEEIKKYKLYSSVAIAISENTNN